MLIAIYTFIYAFHYCIHYPPAFSTNKLDVSLSSCNTIIGRRKLTTNPVEYPWLCGGCSRSCFDTDLMNLVSFRLSGIQHSTHLQAVVLWTIYSGCDTSLVPKHFSTCGNR
jgi:hypothetical protein